MSEPDFSFSDWEQYDEEMAEREKEKEEYEQQRAENGFVIGAGEGMTAETLLTMTEKSLDELEHYSGDGYYEMVRKQISGKILHRLKAYLHNAAFNATRPAKVCMNCPKREEVIKNGKAVRH